MAHERERFGGQKHSVKDVIKTTCCLVGGGPAGVVLALLLARKGIPVLLLEAHMDFEREFRGDTIHPSSMEILDQLGLADRLLSLRHTEARQFVMQTDSGSVELADLRRLKTKYPFVTVIAQARFLDFLTEEARNYPAFRLEMGAQVDELLVEEGVVRGVRYRGQDGWYEVRADLTVGADGRFSRLRKLGGFELQAQAMPMDVLWFRLSRRASDPIEPLGGRFAPGRLIVMIDRFDYWQLGYVIPKGGYQQLRTAGLPALQRSIAEAIPALADRVDELKEWKQLSVLSIESNRVKRWYRPGLLLIGDAANAMSPIGGVGINYAIQDAVAAANVLAEKLKSGTVQESDLAAVQHERELPIKIIQSFQSLVHDYVFARAINRSTSLKPPRAMKLLPHIPLLRDVPARLIAFGYRPAHLR